MNHIDATRPDSPVLAGYGPRPIGVQTVVATDPARLDLRTGETGPRDLTVELWYPAAAGTPQGGRYDTLLRDGETRAVLHGRATRDALPSPDGPFPLVVLSHGYPGNRYLMSHLAETLASRGFVVAAADHVGSTYEDQREIGDTLYHRPLDQRFLLSAFAEHAWIDSTRAAIIGYSMGGYGALVSAGAGLVPGIEHHEMAPSGGVLARHVEGQAHAPDRLKAVVAIAPWGMGRGLWRPDALRTIEAPLMVVAGSADEVSDYAAMRLIAEHGRGALLSFENAGHNAGAPIPAPAESYRVSPKLGWAPFEHYADPVWDSVRMNAVTQHFVAAFLERHVMGSAEHAPLLHPNTALNDMAGFPQATAQGLQFESWADARATC